MVDLSKIDHRFLSASNSTVDLQWLKQAWDHEN